MDIALKDIWRSRLRYGLLAGAVGLLFFLLLFLNTLSSTLLGGFVGAIENGSSDVLVYADDAQATIPASRIDLAAIDAVAAIDGVAAAAPISVLTTSTSIDGETTDVSLWGVAAGMPGEPDSISDGRRPNAPGEVVMDAAAADAGFQLGTVFRAGGIDLTVVGFADEATFSVLPTAYAPIATWSDVFSGAFPQAGGFVPINVIGVTVQGGIDPKTVATSITAGVPGVEALTADDAAASTPGVSSISQSFGLIVGITFLIVVVVVGFFFQILTVQKLRSFSMLKALGATNTRLAATVSTQIGAMVVLGLAVGTAMLAATAVATRDVFAVSVDPALVASAGFAVLVASLLAGLIPIRRIVRQDPAEAAMGGPR